MGATINLQSKNRREDNLLFSEGGSRIIFSIDEKDEFNLLNYFNYKSKEICEEIYLKKIGVVAEENLNIKVENKELCNIKVEHLADKFNNSISNYFKND